eukprot:2029243-Prymnesium_polylepis.1
MRRILRKIADRSAIEDREVLGGRPPRPLQPQQPSARLRAHSNCNNPQPASPRPLHPRGPQSAPNRALTRATPTAALTPRQPFPTAAALRTAQLAASEFDHGCRTLLHPRALRQTRARSPIPPSSRRSLSRRPSLKDGATHDHSTRTGGRHARPLHARVLPSRVGGRCAQAAAATRRVQVAAAAVPHGCRPPPGAAAAPLFADRPVASLTGVWGA